MALLFHVRQFIREQIGHTFVIGANGFEFTSVAAGTHFVTVRGTLNSLTGDSTLGPLTSIPELSFQTIISVLGTVVTITIDANQAATFECQLDSQAFVPCKTNTSWYQLLILLLRTEMCFGFCRYIRFSI